MKNSRTRVARRLSIVWLSICAALQPVLARDVNADAQKIKQLVAAYAASINHADIRLAEQIWSNGPEVSFIHPRGEEHGRAQVEQHVYQELMGGTFSERNLTVKDLAVHVYGDTAWAQFHWDFAAKLKGNGAPVNTQGRETQIYHKERGQWRLVHVHYSGMPVSGELKGF